MTQSDSLRLVSADGADIPISGTCAPQFGPVLEAFCENFRDLGEIGASVCVYVDGNPVVDMWGGHQDAERTKPWRTETMVCTMSACKGIVAICAHMQIARGKLNLDRPVADYWPEFAQGGKGKITVRQVMSHQAALPVADAAPVGAAMSWEPLIRGLEVQAPIWEPGTKAVYHSTTYGHLVGELVRRTSGKDLWTFIHDELAGPLGADFILGCSDADAARVAPYIFSPKNELMARPPKDDSIFVQTYRLMDPANLTHDKMIRSHFASGAGVSNARGLARIFAALSCGGALGEVRLMDADTLHAAVQQHSWEPDPMHGDPFRNALGLVLNTPDWTYFGPNPESFGTIGGGGYGVFADPARRMSFAYTPVRFTTGYGFGDEPRRLIDALYAC